jgi:hypothetical protein
LDVVMCRHRGNLRATQAGPATAQVLVLVLGAISFGSHTLRRRSESSPTSSNIQIDSQIPNPHIANQILKSHIQNLHMVIQKKSPLQ